MNARIESGVVPTPIARSRAKTTTLVARATTEPIA
jgi:hypothetical protein